MKKKTVEKEVGFYRLPQILKIFGFSKSSWWAGIREGRFPKGVSLGKRMTGWRISDIEKLIEELSGGKA